MTSLDGCHLTARRPKVKVDSTFPLLFRRGEIFWVGIATALVTFIWGLCAHKSYD
jgi:hypothetical protein